MTVAAGPTLEPMPRTRNGRPGVIIYEKNTCKVFHRIVKWSLSHKLTALEILITTHRQIHRRKHRLSSTVSNTLENKEDQTSG